VKARVPIILANTEDRSYAVQILQFLTGETPEEFKGAVWSAKVAALKEEKLYYVFGDEVKIENYSNLYEELHKKNSTMVVLNDSLPPRGYVNVGTLPTPKVLIKATLLNYLKDKSIVDKIVPSLGGLTMKSVREVARVAMTTTGSLTPQSVNAARKLLVKTTRGISIVDTTLDVYLPDPRLETFVKLERDFFLQDVDLRLRPRGLLFVGPPGTGKTQAAKFIANSWDVPLFRLDPTVQSKYVGESEQNLVQALQQVDYEEPCLLLIDEVEKFFATNEGDAGVTNRMLGSLLWWMQEHKTKVFTLMTSNHKDQIPPELFREGRIDQVIGFEGMDLEESKNFAKYIVSSFPDVMFDMERLYSQLKGGIAQVEDKKLTPAKITRYVYEEAKKAILEKGE
jgi:hypothetical protein